MRVIYSGRNAVEGAVLEQDLLGGCMMRTGSLQLVAVFAQGRLSGIARTDPHLIT
jgi:hypothetical protein